MSCRLAFGSLQWEAFDDDREMRRHLTGAVLMGFGGILAGGCTIGQGLTAGSMLAVSWPLAIGGMVLGARIGIAVLIDGSPRDIVRRSSMQLVQGRGAAFQPCSCNSINGPHPTVRSPLAGGWR